MLPTPEGPEKPGAALIEAPPDPESKPGIGSDKRIGLVFAAVALCSFSLIMSGPISGIYIRDLTQRDIERQCNCTVDPDSDEVTSWLAVRATMFQLVYSIPTMLIAGNVGMLGDQFGRRNCAVMSLLGEVLSSAAIAWCSWMDLGWISIVMAKGIAGFSGGMLVFVATSFAYVADFAPASKRGESFALLDMIVMGVGALGPLIGGILAAYIGFAWVWTIVAGCNLLAGILFFLAPRSPQVLSPRKPLREWINSFTPFLLLRALARDRHSGVVIAYPAFFLSISGLWQLPAIVGMYIQQKLGFEAEELGLFFTVYLGLSALAIAVLSPLASRLLSRPAKSIELVRFSLVGPAIYSALLVILPQAAVRTYVWAGIPLAATGFAALPHYRAIFSSLRGDHEQGEQLTLIAALETLPSAVSVPAGQMAFRALLATPRVTFIIMPALLGLSLFLLQWVGQPAVKPAGDADDAPACDAAIRAGEGTHETSSASTLSGSVEPLAAAPGAT